MFHHVAHNNLDTRSELWRVDFNAELFVIQPMLGQVIELDHVINSLIGSLSATEQPPLTTIYNTADPATYDTLLPTYGPRRHPVVLPTNHEPYPTLAQRYATMHVLQQPDYSLVATFDTEFRLHNHIHPDEYAPALRYNGNVYPIPSLYNMHQGTQPALRTFSNVRKAIQRLLQRNAQFHNLESAPDLESNAAFSDEEHRCHFLSFFVNFCHVLSQ